MHTYNQIERSHLCPTTNNGLETQNEGKMTGSLSLNNQLISAQCPNCGANLDLENRGAMGTCGYCGAVVPIKYAYEFEDPPDGAHRGYELFWDEQLVGYEPHWTRLQAIGNLLWNTTRYPKKYVRGTYDGEALLLPASLSRFIPAPSISVLPCFFVPKGERPPGDKQVQRLMQHLEWARARYYELFNGQDTFNIAQEPPKIYYSPYDLAFYRNLQKKEEHHISGKILNILDHNRYSCPYICFTIVQNDADDFPASGGQPFNGGFNTGGGFVLVSSYALNKSPNFQTIVQHNLAHAFGLSHVSAYGYEMEYSPSIMSYNRDHDTKDFKPALKPGIFIPEDRRGLALNRRVFPKLDFIETRDVPPGYRLDPHIATIPRMEIFGQPQGIIVRTNSGESFSSKVSNIVQNVIHPSINVGISTYDQLSMWHSDRTSTGWVMLEVLFPFPVELTCIRIHTQHSGLYDAAIAARISIMEQKGNYLSLGEIELESIDERIAFPLVKTQGLKLELMAGDSGFVVVRGLQFYVEDEEIFSPLIPKK